ncbi:serine/threonine-protein kinase [Streptosporangium subroseum]|uniref:serine/threonine-protein kinase n=1 Tax=Streptosporangium subroseum TaxID=106412 RepID=UPI0030888D24|nr:serine/threonine protein kinase [Streptosporangium subroseum]
MSQPELGGLRSGDVLTRRYLLMEQIAWGGMSVIWRAFDQSLQRMVAVKLLDGELDSDRGGRELIRREARATARLIHPDAIEVYDYGETVTPHGRLAAYVVMRLLEGRPLSDRISEGPLPWMEAATIATRLATVLAAAHERGIVHRDVTAENVLLTAAGAKLLDFGIAAFIGEDDDDATSDYGTPPYVAPERLTGTTAEPASDVYALGVLLFEMLTGSPPYPERTWEEIENVRREGPPPAICVPGLPPGIGTLCRICLSHRPETRPKAQEVADGLTEFLAAARRPAETKIISWAVAVAATVVVMLAGALVWNQLANPPGSRSFPPLALTSDASHSAPAMTPDPGFTRPSPSPTVQEPRTTPSEPRTTAHEQRATETSSGSKVIPSSTPSLSRSVQRFNALLAKGEGEGRIRPDVALDLRQVLANSVCCSRDLTPIRGKIADRHREGSLPDELRHALERQLMFVSVALAG